MAHLILVAGHAIWEDGVWKGGYSGQEGAYEEHLLWGIKLATMKNNSTLVLSGGQTRPHLNTAKTEAQGMRNFIQESYPGLFSDTIFCNNSHENSFFLPEIVCENFARDSFENVLFSCLAFYEKKKEWPETMTVVSFGFKGQRFNAIAVGLKISSFSLLSSGDRHLSFAQRERAVKGEAITMRRMTKNINGELHLWDPLHRSDELQKTRLSRTPRKLNEHDYINKVKESYGFEDLLSKLESIPPGYLHWKGINWPWE